MAGKGEKGRGKRSDKITKLWNLYTLVRRWQREGKDYQTINKLLVDNTGGEVKGIAGLERSLAIHSPTEVDEETGQERSVPRGRGDLLRNSLTGILDGVAQGWGGEIAGRVAQLLGGDYNATRERTESYIRQARDENPAAAMIGEVSGGVAAALPMAGLAGGKIASMGGGLLMQSVGQAAAGAATAGPLAALYGAGAAEPGERKKGAISTGAVGAGVGTVMGAFSPALGAGARRAGIAGATKLGEMAGGRQGGKVAQSLFRGADKLRYGGQAAQMAEREVRKVLRQAGVDPTPEAVDLALRGKLTGTRVAIAADLDEALGKQAGQAVQKGASKEAVISRHAVRGKRMAGDLRAATDMPTRRPGAAVIRAEKRAWWRKNILPQIKDEVGEFGSMRMGKIWKEHPEIGESYRFLKGTDPDWTPKVGKLDFNTMWRVRQALQARIKKAFRNPAGSEDLDALKPALEAWTELMEEVESFAPAMQLYRSFSAEHAGRTAGRKALNKSSHEIADDLAALTTEYGDDAAAFFSEGIVDALEDKLIKVGHGGGKATNLILGGDDMEKMRVAFRPGVEGDAAFEAWQRRLMQEGLMDTTHGFVSGKMPVFEERDMKVGYLTTKRAMMNQALSDVIEDPSMAGAAAKLSGDFYMAPVGEAGGVLGKMQGAAQDATLLPRVRNRALGAPASQVTRGLLDYDLTQRRRK